MDCFLGFKVEDWIKLVSKMKSSDIQSPIELVDWLDNSGASIIEESGKRKILEAKLLRIKQIADYIK